MCKIGGDVTIVIIFDTKEIANEIKLELYDGTPALEGGVGNVILGDYAVDGEGRCCVMCHAWSEQDKLVLQDYLKDVEGVRVLDELPSDWNVGGEIVEEIIEEVS